MSARVRCLCGASLELADGAVSAGIWKNDDVACEYRTCASCRSTRAWIGVDELRGRRVALYREPETSEIADEGDSLSDMLYRDGPADGAELRRNGVLLATRIGGVWKIAEPVIEEPLAEGIRRV